MSARGGGKILTAAEAAEVIGVSPVRVRQYCQEGRFDSARKAKEAWVISAEEVKSFKRVPTGRPAGKAKG